MEVELKVKSEDLTALRDELLVLLNSLRTELENLLDRIGNTDTFIYCAAVEIIKAKKNQLAIRCMDGINALNRHIDNLSLIASNYEHTENDNKEVINEIGI